MSRRDDELISVSSRGDLRRRDVLRLLGGGLAALQAGCLVEPGEHVLPYVADPFELRPGVPVRYATALSLDGFATGAIVVTHDGRPTKLDGNPVHPASLGGSMAWLQARILDLYDPQRRQESVARTQPTSWSRIAEELANLAPSPLWIVMPPQTSPTIAGLLARIRLRHDLHVVYDEPLDHRAAYRGSALVFGRPVEQQLDLARADAVVSLDADWASSMPMSAAWARAAARRRTGNQMSRLWVCEPMPTPTGTLADHRLPARAGDVVAIAVAIAGRLGAGNLPGALVARAERRLGDAVA
ncbi:MAG: TAT-variant-translocated molybdopterin oxidoreductase, partial [Kofleriaceae bacterium]